METLPFIKSDNNYTLRMALDNVPYEFDVRWNSRDKSWYLDLYDGKRKPIVTSLKVVLGARLGAALTYLTFFQDHILKVVDTTGEGRDAAYDDLGDRVLVMHVSKVDFKQGL